MVGALPGRPDSLATFVVRLGPAGIRRAGDDGSQPGAAVEDRRRQIVDAGIAEPGLTARLGREERLADLGDTFGSQNRDVLRDNHSHLLSINCIRQRTSAVPPVPGGTALVS